MRSLAPSLLLGRRLSDAVLGRDIERYPDRLPGRAALHAGIPVASPACWLVADERYFTLTNGLVSQWSDISGNGVHATQSTGSRRGCVAALSVLRRRPLLFVAGTNSGHIHYAISSLTASSRNQSCFAVGVYGENDGNDASVIGCSADGGRQLRISNTSGPGNLQMIKAGISVMFNSTLAVSKGVPFVVGFRLDTNLVEIRLNALTAQSNSDTTTLAGGLSTSLGVKLTGGDSQGFHGFYAEFLAYNSTLTSQQMADTMAYLMTKWGVS